MEAREVLEANRAYWEARADEWFGATALPELGVKFVTEEEVHVFGDVAGQRMLEVCCGSGHSLLYNARRGAGELWGVDISESQLKNARRLLEENGVSARLIRSPMEEMEGLPEGYFDTVYSIYGMGWSTDLPGTFRRIHRSLKPGGIFIFSWGHPLFYCVAYGDGPAWKDRNRVMARQGPVMTRSYHNEANLTVPLEGGDVYFPTRRISTWVNALAQAGFCLERMIEDTDAETLRAKPEDPKVKKAQWLPLSVCFRARKI